jgi:uncharacterized protein YndB with AHSA1/START domain
MSESATVHGNFTVERSYLAPPARVFAAFADPEKKKSWFAASDMHEMESFESDFRVGGVEILHYRFGPASPFPGAQLTNEGNITISCPTGASSPPRTWRSKAASSRQHW